MKLFKRKNSKSKSIKSLKNNKENTSKKEHVCYNPNCENFKITGTMVNTMLMGLLVY